MLLVQNINNQNQQIDEVLQNMQVFYPGRIGILSVSLVEKGKPENPEKNDENQQQTLRVY